MQTEVKLPPVTFPGYTIIECLYETRHSSAYRARKYGSQDTVIIKYLWAYYPTPFEIARFKFEFESFKNNPIDGVIKVFDIIDFESGLALVMEDVCGESLSTLIHKGLGLEMILDFSTRLAETIGQLHEKNIIHRDIKPQNVLYNREHDDLKLIDFGITGEFTGIHNEIYNPKVVEETLAYMSPEQTGRMNCPLDHRADLYSLGVTLYEMLTGNVPFRTVDPLEKIYAHIAKIPPPPHEIQPLIPHMVSDIVMKLLSKSPDERYQNGFGLKADLMECLTQFRNTGRIDVFELAVHDISLSFSIPKILVGRDDEIGSLEAALGRVSNGAVEIMLLAGEPGVGKSTLAYEMNRLIVERKGYFISGKFNKYQKQSPYSAIIHSFQSLSFQILSESEARITAWKTKLKASLGPNGKIITDAISEMELILGKQVDIPELGPEETENRFHRVMRKFVKTFSDENHPLVMFLDDLQWSDRASLDLIQSLVLDKDLSHFLLIGAYRDNETPPHHPVMLTTEALKDEGVRLHTMILGSLTQSQVRRFLSRFLKCSMERLEALAGIIHEKTLGNPFFIHQFIETLYNEKYLVRDAQKVWVWDEDAVSGMQVTENVIDLMMEKIMRLPERSLAAIKVCACIGDTFEIEQLSAVMKLSYADAFRAVDTIARTGLIDAREKVYRFHHDRIHEAAYMLISDEEREETHYLIGLSLMRMIPQDEISARCFAVVDQLNRAKRLVTKKEQRYQIAQLNLTAGIKAKGSTAYESAVSFLKHGMDLLPENSWTDAYALTYGLHKEQMEAEFLNRNYGESRRLFDELNQRATIRKDRAQACHTMVALHTTLSEIDQALDHGIRGLKMYGVKLSKTCGKIPVIIELIRFKRHLNKISIKNIPGLSTCTDEDTLAKCELFTVIGLPAYYTNPNLFAYTALKGMNGDFEHGLVPTSAFGFIAVAAILATELGDFKTAYNLGDMALKLNETMDDKRHVAKVHFIFGYMIMHWSRPLEECLDCFHKAYFLGLEIGDFLYCAHALNVIFDMRFLLGENIDRVLEDHSRYLDFQGKVKDHYVACQYHMYRQFNKVLKGDLSHLSNAKSEDGLSYDMVVERTREQGNMLGVFFLLLRKEQAAYLFGGFEEAHAVGGELDTLLEFPKGSYYLVEHLFFRCLCLIAVYPTRDLRKQIKLKKILTAHKKKMKKWMDYYPQNISQKYTLICAEEAAFVTKRPLEAEELYHQSIQIARKQNQPHMEAMANERAGLFYLARGYEEIAQLYLKTAYKAYKVWGATGKLNALEQAFPYVHEIELSSTNTAKNETPQTPLWPGLDSSRLDLATVMKVSQTISSEIVLDRLLDSIMGMAVMNAGAQRGFLILVKDGKLTVEAARTEDKKEILIYPGSPLEQNHALSTAVVEYAYQQKENVLLGNASEVGEFKHAPYIQTNRCKSILAMPIMKKNEVFGILYMENNLISDAFTKERLELLNVIVTQAAISIENAKLFELATTDVLTRLYTRRYFLMMVDQEIDRYDRYNHPLSLIMLDIDNFKKVNDDYGHPTGDEVLSQVAHVIKRNCRNVDSAARYGGEEFVVVLPETNEYGAMIVAEKIRAGIEDMVITHDSLRIKVTVSVGVATCPIDALSRNLLIESADRALYHSKRSGKNKVSQAHHGEYNALNS